MRILGFRVGRADRRAGRRRASSNKLDKIINKALFDAAMEDPAVLAKIIGQYSDNWVQPDYGNEPAKSIETPGIAMQEVAEQDGQSERGRELPRPIDKVVDGLAQRGSGKSAHHHVKSQPGSMMLAPDGDVPLFDGQDRQFRRATKGKTKSPELLRALKFLMPLTAAAEWQRARETPGRGEYRSGIDLNGHDGEMSGAKYDQHSRDGLFTEAQGVRRPASGEPGKPGSPVTKWPMPAPQKKEYAGSDKWGSDENKLRSSIKQGGADDDVWTKRTEME
jgi:hypothetical protein